jgi:hypothetical protein
MYVVSPEASGEVSFTIILSRRPFLTQEISAISARIPIPRILTLNP